MPSPVQASHFSEVGVVADLALLIVANLLSTAQWGAINAASDSLSPPRSASWVRCSSSERDAHPRQPDTGGRPHVAVHVLAVTETTTKRSHQDDSNGLKAVPPGAPGLVLGT